MNKFIELYEYRSLPEQIDHFIDMINIKKCPYYASEVFGFRDGYDLFLLERAVRKAVRAMSFFNEDTGGHIIPIFRKSGKYLVKDWKLSKKGYFYVLLNTNPEIEKAAAFQSLLWQMAKDMDVEDF